MKLLEKENENLWKVESAAEAMYDVAWYFDRMLRYNMPDEAWIESFTNLTRKAVFEFSMTAMVMSVLDRDSFYAGLYRIERIAEKNIE